MTSGDFFQKFCRNVRVGTPTESPDVLPAWTRFMMELAHDAAARKIPDASRLVHFVLVPVRELCSQFLALGSLVASLAHGTAHLSWERLRELPTGTTVYFLLHRPGQNKNPRPVTGKIISPSEEGYPRVQVDEPYRYIQTFTMRNFERYRVSLTQYPGATRTARITGVTRFYRSFFPDLDPSWSISTSNVVLVVCSSAPWQQAAESVVLRTISTSGSWTLKRILMPGKPPGERGTKTVVTSTESPEGLTRLPSFPPVAILDGPRAFRLFDRVLSRRIVVLIETCEYDGLVQDRLMGLLPARLDDRSLDPINLTTPVPPGVQLVSFLLPT